MWWSRSIRRQTMEVGERRPLPRPTVQSSMICKPILSRLILSSMFLTSTIGSGINEPTQCIQIFKLYSHCLSKDCIWNIYDSLLIIVWLLWSACVETARLISAFLQHDKSCLQLVEIERSYSKFCFVWSDTRSENTQGILNEMRDG